MRKAFSPEILAACEAHEAAGRDYADVVTATFPIGTIVETTIGRSTFRARVVRNPGDRPGRDRYPSSLSVENLATGKVRHISVGPYGNEITILQLPIPAPDGSETEAPV